MWVFLLTLITLRFFEFVSEAQVDGIKSAMDRIKCRRFRAEVSGIGTFDSSMRVVFAGVADNGESELLFNELEAELKGVVPQCSGFRPHITIARLKDPGLRNEAKKTIEENRLSYLGGFTASEIALVKSELGKSGSRYTVLKETPLQP